MPIVLSGILRVQHTPHFDGSARLRVFFLAHPKDDTQPKQIADEQSLRAAWVGIDELHRLKLRGEEVREILTYVDYGAPIYPLSLLQTEGAPWL